MLIAYFKVIGKSDEKMSELEPVKKYQEKVVKMFKSEKSVTIPIPKSVFDEFSKNGKDGKELVLNVSKKGLLAFLTDDDHKVFKLNAIREV